MKSATRKGRGRARARTVLATAAAATTAGGAPATSAPGARARSGTPREAAASAVPSAEARERERRARRPGAAARDGVLLPLALDASGARVHVRELDRASRRSRAPFRCIGCGDELLARLGEERARHFAHRPGSTCALASPETALHFAAKERLLELCALAFSGRERVLVEARCPRCRRAQPIDLAGAGDAARAEAPVGPLRADVLVTLRERAALALEVKVSHAVDAAKEAALAAAGVPAVEIDAREPWEREDPGARVVVCARSLGTPVCPACEHAARADADRAAGGEEGAIAELEAYRARGLLGPPPGRAVPDAPPLGDAERAAIAAAFRCPECGGCELTHGARLLRHGCPGRSARPVAWRGYDGAVVQLGWWRRAIARG